jgi:hypothetical protein
MKRSLALAFALFSVLLLASCSSGRRSAQFTLDGVTAPPKVCALNPNNFAQAERVADFRLPNGCGVANGYKVYTINDVGLSQSALITCDLADAVSGWLSGAVQPLAQNIYGQRVVAIKVAASYSCRPRSNKYGAKLSEHGFGNAIDIAGFTLSDGREISVLRDYYGASADQQFLRGIRARACGMFNTVLGPGSDANHRDHLHLDKMYLRKGRGVYCH